MPGHYIPKGFRAVRCGEGFRADDVCTGRKFWNLIGGKGSHLAPIGPYSRIGRPKTQAFRNGDNLAHSNFKNRICRKKSDTVAPAKAEQTLMQMIQQGPVFCKIE